MESATVIVILPIYEHRAKVIEANQVAHVVSWTVAAIPI